MTDQEKDTLYSVLMQLVDGGETLTKLERRDLLNQLTSARCNMTADEMLSATENNRKLRIKRGTTAQNDEYTGLSGELLMDTDTNTLRVHDGITPGGHVVAGGGATLPESTDYIIERQMPTEENNYTWYRKYASGWVEQGGISSSQHVNMPVEMIDTNYNILLTGICGASANNVFVHGCRDKTTTNFVTQCNCLNGSGSSSSSNTSPKTWYVCGIHK